jgi:hypothetical protein
MRDTWSSEQFHDIILLLQFCNGGGTKCMNMQGTDMVLDEIIGILFFVRAQTGQGVEVLSVCFFNCMMAPKARVALTLVLDPENNTNTQLLLPFPRAGLASTLKGAKM